MEFDCPSCGAPHAFPEDQIPDSGIVVACTRCAIHITLNKQGVVPSGPAAAPEPEPEHDEDSTIASTQAIPEQKPASAPAPDLGPVSAGAPSIKPAAAPPPGGGIKPAGGIQPAGGIRPAGGIKPAGGLKPAVGPKPAAAPSPGGGLKPAAGPKPSIRPSSAPAPEPDAPPPPLNEDETSISEVTSFAKGTARAASAGRAAGAAVSAASSAARGALDDLAGDAIDPIEDVPRGLAFPGAGGAASDQWTFRDLPQAFLGVMDLKRLLFATVGFWLALNGSILVVWVGNLLGRLLWSRIAQVFGYASYLVQIVAVLFVGAVMAYVCHQSIIEKKKTSVKAGFDWAMGNLAGVLGTPLAFVAVILAVAVAEGVIGGIGRIPWVGPLVWGLVSPATFVASFAAGCVGVALVYSLPLYIPVVYNEKTGPKETLLRILSLFKENGFTLVGMLVVALIMIGVALCLTVIPAWTLSAQLTSQVAVNAMGAELFNIISEVPAVFAPWVTTSTGFPVLPGADTNIAHTIGGFATGLGASIVPALIIAVTTLLWYTAGCIIYSIVTGRKK